MHYDLLSLYFIRLNYYMPYKEAHYTLLCVCLSVCLSVCLFHNVV